MAEEQQDQAADRADRDEESQSEEFDPEEIENDPAYNPEDEGLKDLKGG
jgi:hypothetical protein